jgi:hypothetical protein
MLSGSQHGNRYVASLGRETETAASHGGVMRAFRLFSALGIVSEDTGRFSQKQFERFADLALARLRALYAAGDQRVMPYFNPGQDGTS